MFTGIITGLGSIAAMQRKPDGGARLRIDTPWDCTSIPIGASIACSGICLTLVEASQNQFAVDASDETIDVTTMAHWDVGTQINLERALALGDELGGHMVSGHVDGKAVVTRIEQEGDSYLLAFDIPSHLAPFIAAKGSVALDGISLTVNRVDGTEFEIMVIPHTWSHTTLAHAKPGGEINLEVDMLARYVARMTEFGKGQST
jgi:riboflavin synthase